LALEPRYVTNELRVRNLAALVQAIEVVTRTMPVAHWIDRLNGAGVPCAPINTIDRLFSHPQLLSRNMVIQVQGQGERAVRTAGNPIKMGAYADFDPAVPLRAPALNQHRETILHELMAGVGAYAAAPVGGGRDGTDTPVSADA
jgi:CoA:oxalate CoA-transferase